MIITETSMDRIVKATTDDGRIIYSTFCDGPVIDGRRCWRGLYTGPDGRATDEQVEAALWDAACALMDEVNGHNRRVEAEQRDQRDAAYGERMRSLEAATRGLRGFEDHPDND